MQPLPDDPATQDPMPSIRRLVLGDFRSYAALDLALQPGLVVLSGENGAGKTNLIEAISFLCPGRGLRRAELAECARAGGKGGGMGAWSVFVELATSSGHRQLGIGTELQPDGTLLRRYRLDREPVASLKPFADLIRIIWLTPSMDGLFSAPQASGAAFSTGSCSPSMPSRAQSQCARTRFAQSQPPARRECRSALARCGRA